MAQRFSLRLPGTAAMCGRPVVCACGARAEFAYRLIRSTISLCSIGVGQSSDAGTAPPRSG